MEEWRRAFEERLANLGTLSSDELAALESELVDAFDKADSDGGSLTDLNGISGAISDVRAAQDAQATAEAEAAESLAELRANVHPDPAGDSADDGSDDSDDSASGEDDDDADEGDVAEPPSSKQIAASTKPIRPSLGRVAGKGNPPAKGNNTMRVKTRLVAAGDVPGFGVGQEITSADQLSQAIIRKLHGLGRSGTPDDVLVASVIKEFPEERQLGDDPTVNSRKFREAMAPRALVAYGGICAPLPIDYTVETIGDTVRPLKSALPNFGATRGGVQFMVPPKLSAITPPVPWTVAMDQAGTATKSCMVVVCEPFTSAEIYGIPVCVKVGNMMGKYNPEQVTAQTALLDVAAARTAELQLLTAIDGASLALTATDVLGAARTILTTLDRIISSYEYRHRLANAVLRIALPDWVHDMMRADIAMELAHDTDNRDPLAISDADIEGWFNARNCSPIWLLETIAAPWTPPAAGPAQLWPATFVAYLFAEGTFQFLDGGQIDLGVVRDSTLNSTNDYEIWREDFEGVAMRGNESLKVTITCKPTGLSAGTVNTGDVPG
ncbi:MAG TPA: major capsid protein [Scandinavium sp.]|uniref:major capsid protein n=1 Tax=Scandinavium sp. TaxID=2830653 RepID=UPI002E35AD05|nr:major capsid protein [Scandinavium sp.]HEX4503871.1 major capsid protein [Scandinavium sp.]